MIRRVFALLGLLAVAAGPVCAAEHAAGTLDRALRARAALPHGHSRVILQLAPGTTADGVIRTAHGTPGRRLAAVGAQVADVPDAELASLAAQPGVRAVSLDRPVYGTIEGTDATIGASWVHDTLGVDGSGVGIAIVDSGVAPWHDDLSSDRVVRFVDFVNFQPSAYDDYGHGTHVAGIIAGDGHDSGGARMGVAPGASLVVEKVLDASGQGYISNVIAAIDYAIANRDALHIRVINLSVAAAVSESYTTDPLALAAKRAVDAGIVVVSAAGNLGRNAAGQPQYGRIGAPGNAPWVLTVGASSPMGTADRRDDTVAAFSSRGPTAIDRQSKPDLVAPGVGIESLADPSSTLFLTKPAARVWGTIATASAPYLSLSGTSMASPVVSGTIALMLEANPALTPNLVKAVLEYTAEARPEYDVLTEGAGFLNARGAVELAAALAQGETLDRSGAGDPTPWGAHIIWGNHRVGSGRIVASGSAWQPGVVWGAASAPDGGAIAWGQTLGAEPGVWGLTTEGAPDAADIHDSAAAERDMVQAAVCDTLGCGDPAADGPADTIARAQKVDDANAARLPRDVWKAAHALAARWRAR